MKYYITPSKNRIDEYQTINIKNIIDFDHDELFIYDLVYSLKYIYYFKNNTIKVKLKKKDLKHLKKLYLLLCNAPDLLIEYPKSKKGRIVFKIIIVILNTLKKIYKLDYKYEINRIIIDEENYYVLDDIVINDLESENASNTTHQWKRVDDIPLKFTLKNERKNVIKESKINDNTFLEEYNYKLNDADKLIPINFIPIVYCYNITINDGVAYLDIMYQNYMKLKYTPKVVSKNKISVIDNKQDAKYYSKISKGYEENFKRLKFSIDKNCKIQFDYCGKLMKIVGTRHVYNKLIVDDKEVKIKQNYISIKKIDKYKKNLKFEKKYNLLNKPSEKIYLFQDRFNSADDSAEVLYRYYKNKNIKCYYALDNNSKDYKRLEQDGFNLVDFGSEEHKRIYLQCNKLITTHVARRIYDPLFPQKLHRNHEEFKLVFLQHGIIMGRHNGFLDYINNKIDLFISSSVEEKELIEDFSGFTCVKNTGLARFDNYKKNVKGDVIIYAPSWNTIYQKNLQDSPYVKEIEAVINSEKINNLLQENDKRLCLLLHPEFINLSIVFENKYNIEIISASEVNYQNTLSTCCGLITDYSSLFFDILYQEKFVIHHQPYQLHHENKSLTTYYNSIDYSYKLEELENLLNKISQRQWQMSQSQIENLNNIFTYRDFNNCQRIYEEIEKI